MAIDYDKLMNLRIPEVRSSYDFTDCILYALGIGLGHDQMDENQLAYVYEKNQRVFPTTPVVLGSPGFWMRDLDTGIDWTKIVHGEQTLRVHNPMPVRANLIGQSRVVDLIDKGEGKGAILYSMRELHDADTGVHYASVGNVAFCRGDGGFGGPQKSQPKTPPLPDRTPDHVMDLTTRPEQALIYRLSSDMNPLHAEPAFAKKAGFDKPILHGLATYGTCAHAVVAKALDYDDARLKSFDARFSSIVFPGETIRTEIWIEGDTVRFQGKVPARDVVVLSNGIAEIS
ncbi:MAG: MaoC/PaaZ C-terminal domain-containing protein [Mesorhizobium sp.]